jgi:DNA gyrase subunit A
LAKGKNIVNMLDLGEEEKIAAFVPVKEFDDKHFVVMASQNGIIKKTLLSAFSNPRRGGINAMNVPKDDNLIEAKITDGTCDIVLATREGQAIRFPEDKVRNMGRAAYGVKGINLAKNDRVIGMVVVKRDATLLSVTENGFGKRTNIADYRVTNRGGTGIINIRTTQRNGKVVDIKEVLTDDELMLITQKGIIIRQPVNQIKAIGRATQGVKLINLDAGDKLVDVARVVTGEVNNNADQKPGEKDG